MIKNYYLSVLLLLVAIGVSSSMKAQLATATNDPIATTRVGPLLGEINWDQGAPYNDQCPMIGNVKALVGCGATAAGQIMKYFGYPTKGAGSRNGFNFGETTYHWENMLPTYKFNTLGTPEQKAEVAQLLRHLGAAMNMVYTADGSGSVSRQITAPLRTFFLYNGRMEMAFKQAYTDDDWFEMIKREIDSKRPVVYAGGAHIFVCDGYDTANKQLHFNYGWDGRYNEWATSSECRYKTEQVVLLGLHPEKSDAYPSIVMLTPFNFSTYNPAIGEKFNVAMRVTNYGVSTFNGEVGVALYQGDKLVKCLKSVKYTMSPSDPENSAAPRSTYDILLTEVAIDKAIAAGNYTLRLVTKLENNADWCPMQGLVKDVHKEMNVKVTGTAVELTYPLNKEEQFDLTLTKKVEVNVANNRGTATFTIKNNDDVFDCEGVDVYVVVSPNNLLIPATWKKLTIDKIPAGMPKTFTMEDIVIPPGTTVNSCRFSVAYSRIRRRLDKDRDVAAVPLLPEAFNLYEYKIPAEKSTFSIYFYKVSSTQTEPVVSIPADYKMYNPDGTEDVDRLTWVKLITYNAFARKSFAKLVTTAIPVEDENAVLEWKMENMQSASTMYRIYISTKGQEYENFDAKALAYESILPNQGIARISLAEYAGKSIYIAFERDYDDNVSLDYFKILNIKTPKDISVQSVTIPGTSLPGERFPVTMIVKNHSSLNVKAFTASYTIGTKEVKEDFTCDIPFNQQAELTFKNLVTVVGEAGEVVTVKVHVELAGEDAGALKNNNGSAQNRLVNFFPSKKMAFYKTSKGGCQACKTSYGTLDHLEWKYPDAVSAVEIWRDGTYKSEDFANYAAGSTPTFYMNANYMPEFAPNEVLDAARKLYRTLSPPAEVWVEADYENASSRKMKIKVKAHFATPMTGEYRMGAFIIENNVINEDGGQISGIHPEGVKLTKNHIPVVALGGSKGADGYKMIDPNISEEYVYECEYTIPDEYFKKDVSYRYRKDNMQVIGLLFDANGKILNTALNCFYIRFPKTEGLTFVAERGYNPFKFIYEVGEVAQDVFSSLERYRATIAAGKDFKFTIQKDGAWANKTLRVVVNRGAVYNNYDNIGKEEVLLPDAQGVYTITNAQMHYFMEIEEVVSGGPLLTQKGTQLIMSGNWTVENFKRLNLAATTLTAVDMTAVQIPASVAPLNVQNPNVLIYTAPDATVPDSWKNVVQGVVAKRINLIDGYSFENTKEFTAATVSHTRHYTGWTPICLPFNLSTIPAGIKAERFQGYEGSEMRFEEVTSMKAHTPYIINATTAGDHVLEVANAVIPVTQAQKVTQGDYNFEGNFTPMVRTDWDSFYLLNADGNGFHRATSTIEVASFGASFQSTNSASANLLTIKHVPPIGVGLTPELAKDEFIVYSFNGIVEVVAPQAQLAHIYTLDGRLIKSLQLMEGRNTIMDLPKGVCLLNNKKIVIR